MTAPEWYALGAALVVVGAWVAAGTVVTREARGRRDGQDSERPQIDSPGSDIQSDQSRPRSRQRANERR